MSLSILYLSFLALMHAVFVSDPVPVQENPVTIGLLVPDSSSTEVIEAAELAIHEANERGGYRGSPFKLVVRTTEGPWGAGSKESVALVYENEVRAIVGSLDGRNAHLAEQVAAKSHVVYLETRATDPTLSQAYVPWFIRNVPNDNQQAMEIYDLIGEKGAGSTAILTSDDYDSRYAVKSLMGHSAQKYGPSPLILTVDPDKWKLDTVIGQLTKADTDHLIVTSFTDASFRIVAQLMELWPELKVYGTLAFSMGLDSWEKKKGTLPGMILLHSYWGAKEEGAREPMGLAASYAYDGINLIAEAIIGGGPEREAIRDYILQKDQSPGMTGPVSFDDMGNRSGKLQFR